MHIAPIQKHSNSTPDLAWTLIKISQNVVFFTTEIALNQSLVRKKRTPSVVLRGDRNNNQQPTRQTTTSSFILD